MIGVRVHLHALDLFLKRIEEYKAASFHQIPAQPLQSLNSELVGSDMKRQISFAENWQSGRSWAR